MTEPKLKEWVKLQRDRYHLGQLPKDQQELLESIPDWQWGEPDPRLPKKRTRQYPNYEQVQDIIKRIQGSQ